MSVLPDRHLRVCPRLTAGLLACGSIPFAAFPGPRFPVACDERFTAYSCGGSRGIGDIFFPAPHSLFDPQMGTVTISKDHVTLSSQSGRVHANALSGSVPEKQRCMVLASTCHGRA